MTATTTVQPKPARGWTFSIVLFTIATIGEFIALTGWYVLHHANLPIGSPFYDATDKVVVWLRGGDAIARPWLAAAGEFLLSRHLLLAVLVLWAGFVVERAMVVVWLRVPPRVVTPEGRLRSRFVVIAGVTIAEIIVWLAWVWIAEAGEPLFAAAVLVLGIHVVHAYEVALVKHRDFPSSLKDPGVVFITLLEAGGGALALWKATHGSILWPPIVIGLALLTEHIAQVAALKKEAAESR